MSVHKLTGLLVVFLLFGLTVSRAQEVVDEATRVLVLVPALDSDVFSPAVSSVVGALQEARRASAIPDGGLPILRLDPSKPRHRECLRDLGVSVGPDLQVLLCQRGVSGWPAKLLKRYREGVDSLTVVGDASRLSLPSSEVSVAESSVSVAEAAPKEALPSPSAAELGFLLIREGVSQQEEDPAQSFLSELGRYWLQRYGRVDPAPYPLAWYDLSDEVVRSRVQAAFPSLVSGPTPSVALCFFVRGTPVKVLEVFTDLELPATTVRNLSAARNRHLADTVDVSVEAEHVSPSAGTVVLSGSEQKAVVLETVHELAQLLWANSSDGEKKENRLTRRILLKIVELTRGGQGLDDESQLTAALEDFLAEPLLLGDEPGLVDAQERLKALAEALVPRS